MAEPEPEKAPERTKEQELQASLLRVQADFQNFRARMERERAQWRDDLTVEALLPLLPPIDDLERMLAAAKAGGTLEAFVQGVTQVAARMEKALSSLGVSRIEAEGKPFDPKRHEVVAQVPAPEGTPSGQVLNVVEQGYLVKGRVVRHARVTVAQENAKPEPSPG